MLVDRKRRSPMDLTHQLAVTMHCWWWLWLEWNWLRCRKPTNRASLVGCRRRAPGSACRCLGMWSLGRNWENEQRNWVLIINKLELSLYSCNNISNNLINNINNDDYYYFVFFLCVFFFYNFNWYFACTAHVSVQKYLTFPHFIYCGNFLFKCSIKSIGKYLWFYR